MCLKKHNVSINMKSYCIYRNVGGRLMLFDIERKTCMVCKGTPSVINDKHKGDFLSTKRRKPCYNYDALLEGL